MPSMIMIKIIIYVDIAFFYRKANILHRWSKILHEFYGNKGVCHCCRSHWFRWNLHCFMLPLSSCDIKISVVSQCRILVAVQFMNTQLFAFFCDWQLASPGLLCDLVTVDTDWRRLNLLTDSRLTSLETQTQIWNWLRQTAATPYTGSTLPTNSTLRAAPSASTMGEQLHPQQQCHDDTMSKKC